MQDQKMVNKPIFFEEGHRYLNPTTKQEYLSVTKFLHTFEPIKDWKKIAKAYVAKRDDNTLIADLVGKYAITPDSLKAKFIKLGKIETVLWLWKQENEAACETGTATHNEKEAQDLAQAIHTIDGREVPIGIDATYIENLYLLPDGVYTELLIWNDFIGIAGKADKIIIQTINSIRYVDIHDYKTNKEIKDYNYIDKNTGRKVRNENLLPPLERFCNCNHSLYQLQLNMYGWLLEQMGFKIRKGKIIHTTDNDKMYPLLNFQSDIANIITIHKDAKGRDSKKAS